MFFVQIVLLNLLIAIMGDIFDEVQALIDIYASLWNIYI